MAGNENNVWGQHDLSRLCFGLDMDHSLRGLHKDFASLSQTPYFSDSYLDSASLLRPPQEGDQVVPSAQRGCTALGQREAKPLPPLPDPEELMSDEAADQEVEFFTSDRCCLLPKSPHRASGRHHGKVNRAYEDAALRHRDETLRHRDETLRHRDETLRHRDETLRHRDETLRHRDETLRHRDETLRHRDETLHHRDTGSLAFSWPGCDDRARSTFFGDNSDTFWTKADSCLSPKTRFSCAVPPVPMDKPEVPPRIPIKPKNLTLSDDKPPKVPPRVPLVPPCPPRTPSPKSLPIYINGVMPPTQSFAANPNYVSKSLQRQHSERVASTASPSPCIVPILKDGRQASTTHYILLPPGRPSSAGRRERLQSEPTRKSHSGFWKKR